MNKKKIFTFEQCCEIAKKYNSRVEFRHKERACYYFSKEMGWYEKITEHFKRHIPKHRTYEEVKDAAKKYSTRMEFKNNDMCNYCFAVSHGWLDDVCSHMKIVGDKYKRCIYAYEFSDGFCYVGLTYDIEARHLQHTSGKKLSKVYEHSIKYKIEIPTPKQLTDYVDKEKASVLEGEYIEKYKNEGWKILNIAKSGGLGGKKHRYNKDEITKEYCRDIAKNYKTPTDFTRKNQTIYKIMNKNGWKDFVYQVFDLEKIKKEAHLKVAESNRGKKRIINYEKWIKSCKTNKPVLQYDLNGNFIAEYASQCNASKMLGHPSSHSDIGRCCNGKLKTCLGYIWKYKNNVQKNV